ncbi:MAG: LTA synthase family protein [Prevotella sp.]|nr:LTA synthase family protein [Prevotella sp.]
MERLLYLIRFYVLTLLVFVVAKAVFMLADGDGHDVVFSDFFAVTGHGMSLDLSTALYFLIIPFLASVASLWVNIPKWFFATYHTIIATAFALAFVADTSIYPFWGFKLDASCLQYLSQPEGITQSVSTGYLLLRLLFFLIAATVIFLAYRHVCGKLPAPRGAKIKPLLLHIALIPVFIIGIRGGINESTTNIGQVYYSQNQFLNHSAVNPVFSFLYSLSHQLGDMSQYDFMSSSECQRLLADGGVFTTESLIADTLLTTTRPENIVIILMESAGEQFASVMPRLQQLKEEGICFSRCHANSWRTDRGTVCTLSGYPSFPSLSVMKMPQKSGTLPSIARTLSAEGYQTSFLYGGDINFTNMRSYLVSTGWQQITSMDDFTLSERSSAQWGVRDDITFKHLLGEMTHEGHAARRLFGYSTLSSHEPWDVPIHENSDEVYNAFVYLDKCLGNFVDSLKQTPLWQNTLIIITADHGIRYGSVSREMPLEQTHVPMLWIGGAVKQPVTISTLCNQTDLAATLLSQLGLDHSDFSFSRDVLSATYTHPTAVHNYYNAQWICDSTGHIVYDFDAKRITQNNSTAPDSLVLLDKAIIQITTQDLQQR